MNLRLFLSPLILDFFILKTIYFHLSKMHSTSIDLFLSLILSFWKGVTTPSFTYTRVTSLKEKKKRKRMKKQKKALSATLGANPDLLLGTSNWDPARHVEERRISAFSISRHCSLTVKGNHICELVL